MTLPVKTFCMVIRYWSQIGRSNPQVCLTEAMFSGDAVRPARRRAGSPLGIFWKMRNVRTVMANRTSTMDATRRTAKRAISARGGPGPGGAGLEDAGGAGRGRWRVGEGRGRVGEPRGREGQRESRRGGGG